MGELLVCERELVGRALDELHSAREPAARDREHVRGLVEPDDGMPGSEESLGDKPCAGRNVENATAVARDAIACSFRDAMLVSWQL